VPATDTFVDYAKRVTWRAEKGKHLASTIENIKNEEKTIDNNKENEDEWVF